MQGFFPSDGKSHWMRFQFLLDITSKVSSVPARTEKSTAQRGLWEQNYKGQTTQEKNKSENQKAKFTKKYRNEQQKFWKQD